MGFQGLAERFNFGFGGIKTTRNVTWGAILNLVEKMLKTSEK